MSGEKDQIDHLFETLESAISSLEDYPEKTEIVQICNRLRNLLKSTLALRDAKARLYQEVFEDARSHEDDQGREAAEDEAHYSRYGY